MTTSNLTAGVHVLCSHKRLFYRVWSKSWKPSVTFCTILKNNNNICGQNKSQKEKPNKKSN